MRTFDFYAQQSHLFDMVKSTPTNPSFLAWAGAVLKRGFASWHNHEGWLAIISYIAIFALGIVNFSNIDEELLSKELESGISLFAILWLLVNIFAISPYLNWRDAIASRNDLADLRDYEMALDELSQLFDEGNGKIFNSATVTAETVDQWKAEWKDWQARVEAHLNDNFGVREKLLFHNLVLVKTNYDIWHVDMEHLRCRNIIAAQLETMRGIILRHSERVAKWRAEVD